MRKGLLLSLVFSSIFIAGCDNGAAFNLKDVPSRLKVLVERQVTIGPNPNLTVYAMDFHKEGHTLTFVCPCHISDPSGNFLNVQVGGDSFKLTILPDAEYKVEVTYWAPNSDNNAKTQYKISR